jgi:hypothetical protein
LVLIERDHPSFQRKLGSHYLGQARTREIPAFAGMTVQCWRQSL